MYTLKPIIETRNLDTAATVQYSAANCRTVIESCTITNLSNSNVQVSVHLTSPNQVASDENKVLSRSILAGTSYMCPELITQALNPNGSFVTSASAAGCTIRASGGEIT
jgi:hypothetical protein